MCLDAQGDIKGKAPTLCGWCSHVVLDVVLERCVVVNILSDVGILSCFVFVSCWSSLTMTVTMITRSVSSLHKAVTCPEGQSAVPSLLGEEYASCRNNLFKNAS